MSKKSHKTATKTSKPHSKRAIIMITMFLVLIIGAGIILWLFYQDYQDSITSDNSSDHVNQVTTPTTSPDPVYSVLTGLEITDARLNSSPIFCVQIPNSNSDGARPQAGLDEAGIVFEAIAEAGITRFAAIFQNPNVSVIGPIRSLRPYYLDWDTPFDCTIVHAGGSDEALSAITWGGQRNLDEDYNYMWREQSPLRYWNNLFTSPNHLLNFNNNHNYTTSQPQAFPRLTPTEAQDIQTKNHTCKEDSTCNLNSANQINVNFSQNYPHNVTYNYDSERNVYLRSHQDGTPHLSYHCSPELTTPNSITECGDPVQIAPSAIAIMRVTESTMSDGYHESIQTIGSGEALIFQNGETIFATWSKSSQDSQIVFRDLNEKIISFTPGQLWISAVPQYGSVNWE